MREIIDIEALLVWAYRDAQIDRVQGMARREMVRALEAPSISLTGAMLETMALGTRVDKSRRIADPMAALAACAMLPDDAAMIDAAVMALPAWYLRFEEDDVRVISPDDLRRGRGVVERGTGRAGGRGAAVVIRWPGCRADIDPVTEVEPAALLIPLARTASRPDVANGWAAPPDGPLHDSAGNALPADTFALGFEDVMWRRGLYAVWHAALVALVAELAPRLPGFAPCGPAVSPRPWLARIRPALTPKARKI